MKLAGARWLLGLCSIGVVPVEAAPTCAQSLAQLRALLEDAAFPLRWEETTMDDGKPLVLTMAERDGRLVLSIHKTREGAWAHGRASICSQESRLEARFVDGAASVGPAAPWTMRQAIAQELAFTLTRLGPARLEVSMGGWSGGFAAPR